jgi:tripartite motif-containing protein 71
VSAAAKSASAAAAVLASPREEVKTRVLRWQRAVGSYGADDGRLNSPHGLAVDSEGNLFVADSTNSRVQVWDAGLAFKRSFACTQPRGVCLDAQGRVLVTTSEEHKVFVFEAGSRMPTATIGREGMRDGELSHPMGVTVLRDGRIAVADSGNDRIVFFTPQGRFHSRIRSQGDVSLNAPQFVAEMSSGSLVVCDESDRVQIFDAGGRFLRVLAKSGDSDGQVLRPRGVVVTLAGEIIVADEGNHCVNMWAPNMRFLSRFGSWGSGEGCFKGPWGVALLRDTLFVADSSNHRIVEARLEAR